MTGYERDAASRAETSRPHGAEDIRRFEAPANAALAKASASEAAARLLAQRAEVDLGVKGTRCADRLAGARLLRALLAGGRATVPERGCTAGGLGASQRAQPAAGSGCGRT